MYNVQFYQVISPQAGGATRYGIPISATAQSTVYTGFIPLDTHAPFVMTRICACFSQDASDGSGPPRPGFVLPYALEFRIWDQGSGRQLFQSDINGIDDGFLPFSMFSGQQHLAQNVSDQTIQAAMMTIRYYPLPEECEFPAGGLLRVDVRAALSTTALTTSGTAYVSVVGFCHG